MQDPFEQPKIQSNEDAARKIEVEVRNTADSLISSTEKTLIELGDKVPEDTKTEVTATVEAMKKVLEGSDVEAIKEETARMQSAGYKLAEVVYQDAQVRKDLNKAKKEAKKARREAQKAAEKAADAADRAARLRRNEELKVTVVDGQVVDQHGNVIRPYTRGEWFFDNKPLSYSVGAGAIVLFMILSYFLTLEMVS